MGFLRSLAHLGLVMIAALPGACGGTAVEKPAERSQTSAPAEPAGVAVRVSVVKATPATIEGKVVATGTIGSKQTSNIGPLVAGVVEKISVNVGDHVRKGDPLFQTRPSLYERETEEAKANLAFAQAQRDNARRALDRMKKLAEDGYAAQAKLDDAQTAFDVAAADVAKSQAALKTARRNLDDTIVRAPFDGTITKRFNDEGVYLTNSFRGGTENAVLQIQENHIVVAVVFAPEQHLKSLRLKQKALVYVESQPEPRESYVLVLNDMLDVATRTVELRLPIDNSDYALKSGQFARAEILTEERTAYMAPRRVVLQDAEGPFVLVRKGDVAQKSRVVIDDDGGPEIAILEGIVATDDLIVPNGVPVDDGDRIVIEAA
ncbi:MAG: efflux RND transporter periplasmic adaptor subunit [Amphiplicatus sp.]